jgi:hypothetical protein
MPSYILYFATHNNGTALSKPDIRFGTGSAQDVGSIGPDSSLDNLDGTLSLTTDITNGHISLFIRDSDASIESDILKIDSVNVNAQAPNLSSPLISAFGADSATWSVFSDEAIGTVYAGARLSTDSILSSSQLIAGTGGGVAWDSDSTMTADSDNGGTLLGLSGSTTYIVDMVAVDDWGNISDVVSTASFTTDSAAAVSATTTFLAQSSSASWGSSITANSTTYPGVPASLDGKKLILVVQARNTGAEPGDAPTSITAGGTAATLRQSSFENLGKVWIYDVVAGGSNNDISITFPNNDYYYVAIYETTGSYIRGTTATGQAPTTYDLSIDTTAGQAVVGGWAGRDPVSISFTNLTQRGSTIDLGSRNQIWFDNLNVSGGSPETFSATDAGVQWADLCIALYG